MILKCSFKTTAFAIIARNSWLVLFILVCFASCNTPRFPIDKVPVTRLDSRLIGSWKVVGDKHKGTYIDFIRESDYIGTLHIYDYDFKVRKDHDDWYNKCVSVSAVNKALFLNVGGGEGEEAFYLFFRIFDISPTGSKVTIAIAADSVLGQMNSSMEIRKYISAHMDESTFYGDTLQLYRVR